MITVSDVIKLIWSENEFLHFRYSLFTDKHKSIESGLIHIYFTSSSVLIYYRLFNI